MKTKPFSELRKRMTPEQRVESRIRAKFALLRLTLAKLQELLEVNRTEKN